MRKYGFTLPRYPERPICHAEFISASKDVRSRQQTLKPSPRTQPCKARKLANKQVPVQGDKGGFTLAEVLITLAIIGVVAALTIPTVVRNYQKTQTVTQLKKTYSALANTTNLAIGDYGPVEGWKVYHYSAVVPETSVKGSEHFAKTYLMPYLKVSKDCGFSTAEICSYKTKYLNGGNVFIFDNSSYYKFVLNDGAYIAVISTVSPPYISASVLVDINGPKKPNVMGKDVFRFVYVIEGYDYNGQFRASAMHLDLPSLYAQATDGCNKSASGIYCASVIMKSGWQISDDYPW